MLTTDGILTYIFIFLVRTNRKDAVSKFLVIAKLVLPLVVRKQVLL